MRWIGLEVFGRCWKILEDFGRFWKILEDLGRFWKILEAFGRFLDLENMRLEPTDQTDAWTEGWAEGGD